jgi:hypothetical protein
VSTVFVHEEFVDFECHDPDCPDARHRGMAIIIKGLDDGPEMMMMDLNWTPTEAIAAFLDHMGEDVVVHKGDH